MAEYTPTQHELIAQLNNNIVVIENAAERIEDVLSTCPPRLRALILQKVHLEHELTTQALLDLQPEVLLDR